MKERRKNNHVQHKHGTELPDKHPGAVAQKKKRNIIGMLLILLGIAGVAYLAITNG